MKKSLLALAVLGAFAGAAAAQVTVYGIVDVAVGQTKTNGGPSNLVVNDGGPSGQSGSRWGLRGEEDLGGGLKALFVIESSIAADAGTGVLAGRTSIVGLTGGFGMLSLGRQLTVYDDVRGGHDPFGHSAFSVSTDVWTNEGVKYEGRFGNGIRYETPNMGGFTAAAQVSVGENKTATQSADTSSAFNLRYRQGPLSVGFAYQNDQAGNGATDNENTVIAASYDLGMAKIFGAFNMDSNKVSNVDADEYHLGVTAPVGPNLTAGIAYASSKMDNSSADTGFGVQAIYTLSKRTDVYAGYRNMKQKDATELKSTNYAVGLRHKF